MTGTAPHVDLSAPRRVLFLTSTLPRFEGDAQAPFVLEQAIAWHGARPQDRVFILAPHGPGALGRQTIDGVEIHRFRYFWPDRLEALAYPAILPNLRRNPLLLLQVPFFLLAEWAAAASMGRRFGIDLVYAHWVMPQGLVAWLLGRSRGLPYILQNHSSDVAVLDRLGAPGRTVARRLLQDCAAFFCINRRQLDAAMALLPASGRASARARFRALPMGVGAGATIGPAGADGFDLGTLSRLTRKKGLEYLIAAFRALPPTFEGTRLGIAGDGEIRAELEQKADGRAVIFTGFLAGAEKTRFIEGSRVLVFPSVDVAGDVEGLPVALLEALVAGRIVVASRATNIELLDEWPELRDLIFLVDDARNVDELSAALARALALDEAERRRRSALLQKIMGRYRWPALIREYLAALSG